MRVRINGIIEVNPMTAAPDKPVKYGGIQLMRAVAALSVVFAHTPLIGNGSFGVDLFFCVSGFIIMFVSAGFMFARENAFVRTYCNMFMLGMSGYMLLSKTDFLKIRKKLAFVLYRIFEYGKPPRPLVSLGDISYSLYIVHIFVIAGFSRLVYQLDSFTPAGLALTVFIVYPLTVGAAWVSWFVAEKKFTGRLRKRLNI